MWKYKIKNRLFQYIVIGVLLLFTSLILTGCVNFAMEIKTYSEDYYNRVKCPEIFVGFDSQEGYNDFANNEDFKTRYTNLNKVEGTMFNGSFKIDNKELSVLYPTALPITDKDELPYLVSVYKGAKQEAPKPGEIWISNVFADGNKIKVNDVLTINVGTETKFKISAIYSSVITPSSTMGYNPFYINEADEASLDGSKIAIATFDTNDKDFETDFAEQYDELTYFRYNKQDLIDTFNQFYVILGAIGILAAIVTFIVALILIKYLVASNLTKEYKMIGTYKALGYTSKNIKGIYLKSYLFIGAIATVVGAFLSLILSYNLCTSSTKYLGDYSLKPIALLYVLIVPIILSLFIFLITSFSLRSVSKLDPAEALVIGINSTQEKVKKSLIKNASNSFTRAVNDIFKKPKTSILLVIILTVSIYLSVLFINVNNTAVHMGENLDVWFGTPNTDVYVEGDITDEIYNHLDNSSYSNKVIKGNVISSVKVLMPNDDIDLKETTISYFSDYQEMGFHYDKGRAPNSKYEIAASKMFLEETGLHIGDYALFELKDETKSFTAELLITGKFTTMMNGGSAIEVMSELLEINGLDVEYNLACVDLTNKKDFKQFKDEMLTYFQNTRIDTKYNTVSDATKSIVDIIKPICLLFIVVFVIYSLLNVFNILLMNYVNNRREYGISKSLGYRNRDITLQNLYRMLMISCVSAILALIINQIVSAPLFNSLLAVQAYNGSIPQTLLIVFGIIGSIAVISVLFGIPVKKISPKELMEE